MDTIDKKYLSVSEPMRSYIDVAVACGHLEEKEIQLLRRKAQIFGDDPDEVEMIVKAEIVLKQERKLNLLQENVAEEMIKKTIEVTPNKSIFLHFWNVMKKYSVIKDRASRAEFWSFILLIYSIWLVMIVASSSFDNESNAFALFAVIEMLLFPLAMLLPLLCVWMRRIHDSDKPAWFILIPVFNIILLFVKGKKGDNQYGIDPLKPTFKEVYVKSKTMKNNETKASFIIKLEAIGGTLFAVGATLRQAISYRFLTWESLDEVTRWLWLIGGTLILLPRAINWIISKRKNKQNIST